MTPVTYLYGLTTRSSERLMAVGVSLYSTSFFAMSRR